MVSVLFLVVVSLSLDWAKKCKGVNYKYKAFGGVEDYGYGCKYGCFGYHNGTGSDGIYGDGTKSVDDHTEQVECVECKTITADWIKKENAAWNPSMSDADAKEGAESRCYDTGGCHWKKDKCVASSCYTASAYEKCDESYGHEWKDGKCKRVKKDNCKAGSRYYPVYNGSGYPVDDALCKDLEKYFDRNGDPWTANDVKTCKFYCEHPHSQYYAGGPWDYTREYRKLCHRVYGCMFSGGDTLCSALAIWAFVLILVIAILVFLAIIGVIFFLIFKLCCGSKSTKVDPAPASQAAAKSAHAPATQVPLFEVGPYVVIKVGKQESKTKKVESAVWGQAIIFNGMGAEDDDVVFELHDNNDALLGTADVRIPDYVNAKKRATINLKNGEADIGVLEVDIEIQVQEEPEVKITGVFYVDKFAKV